MKVHEIMTAHARCVAPDNTLVEAAGLMRQIDVGALPVCETDRLAGMVTDRDIVVRGVADGLAPDTATVSQVMSQGVVFVFADQEIEEAVRMMEEKQIRRLPVLNREKRMVGIVSLGDMAVTANPAFSGLALKEVSLSPEERMQGGKTGRMFMNDGGAKTSAGKARKQPRQTRRRAASAAKTGARRKAATGSARGPKAVGTRQGRSTRGQKRTTRSRR